MNPIFNNIKDNHAEGRLYLFCMAQCVKLGQNNELYQSMQEKMVYNNYSRSTRGWNLNVSYYWVDLRINWMNICANIVSS